MFFDRHIHIIEVNINVNIDKSNQFEIKCELVRFQNIGSVLNTKENKSRTKEFNGFSQLKKRH